MRLTIANVNKAIAAEGLEIELVKGAGYFYFAPLNPDDFLDAPSVMVYALSHSTFAEWMAEAREAAKYLRHA